MPTQTVIICEGDFDTKIKNLKVIVDGERVETSEPFVILEDGKSFLVCEIELPNLEPHTFCPLGVLIK